jgi:DNA-directed RNA polymerase subunit M/transcription elongation factor TFIIS
MSQIKITDPETFRFNMKTKLNNIIENDKFASNMEKGIFNYSLKESNNKKVVKKWDNPYFVQIYMDRMRSIIYNLTKNALLLEQLKNETIKPQDIAFMTHYEMCPEKWKTMLMVKSEKDKGKFETNIEASTDTFTCRKCRGNKTTYYQLQIRSADEPATTFINCIDCGNKWKIT